MARNFMELLKAQWTLKKFVCVGLDTDLAKFPEHLKSISDVSEMLLQFNREIIFNTCSYACAYKPNIAFYEAYGKDGRTALKETIALIKLSAPGVPIILDAKRADIGNTNIGYIKSAFEDYEADAITINPYFGQEAVKPFLDLENKGIIVLCRTSNPGANEFQDYGNPPLYQYVARKVAEEWNKNGNCLLVVGATYPEELRQVREIVGEMPILIPGIGKQGGDLEKSILFGKNSHNQGIIINSSRDIIFASNKPDFGFVAGQRTKELNDKIKTYLTMGA